MIVYSENITPRLRYIADFFAAEISIEPWNLTTSISEFAQSQDAKINYSNQLVNCNCIKIKPEKLLFENTIFPINISCTDVDGQKVFFKNDSEPGFDIFAASFYLLSRYEEYLPHAKDEYGRYPHEISLAFKEGFLQKPLVNIWVERFKELIREKFPAYQFKKKEFTFLPTYDIDMARSYEYKGFARNTANFLKDFLTARFADFSRRYKVLTGVEKDPFNTFDWLDEIHETYNLNPFYFFLVAEKRSEKDKNISPHHILMKKLITGIAKKYRIGLHPSWRSNDDKKILESEKKILETITASPIVASRQHYLRLSVPETYRSLLQCGIKADYTLGYSGDNGFRASVASPFKWYDLQNETVTELVLYPFCFMEGTSIFYKKQTPEEALLELKMLYKNVREVNGFFSMIWHNSSLSNMNEYKGWRKVYEHFIKAVK